VRKKFYNAKTTKQSKHETVNLELIVLKCKFLQSNFSVPLNVQNKHKRNRDTEDGRRKKTKDAKRSKETELDGSRTELDVGTELDEMKKRNLTEVGKRLSLNHIRLQNTPFSQNLLSFCVLQKIFFGAQADHKKDFQILITMKY